MILRRARILRSALAAVLAGMSLLAMAATAPAHRMSVRIEPETGQLQGVDTIAFASPKAGQLILSTRLRIDSMFADGRRIQPQIRAEGAFMQIRYPASRQLRLNWSGTIARPDVTGKPRGASGDNMPASGPEGTYLPASSGWYPAVDGQLESYEVTIDLPAGQRGVVPGRMVDEREQADRYLARFSFSHPAEGIALIAGPYRVEERKVRTALGTAVRLRTYFHSSIRELAPGYLDSILGYLNRFEQQIGHYPYSEFSVVSSPTPTGLGLPTLTYLGIDVLRLPFIRATSLGHEVLHNWWGNGVYPDYERGNWSEGLTTFMADYAFREQQGAAAATANRLTWLRDFASIPPGTDLPLTRFSSRTHGTSQIVGYHKAAMLFLMLRDTIGESAFDAGLRQFWRTQQFRIAGWPQLQRAFEGASGRRLDDFFRQWLERGGAPDLRLADAKIEQHGTSWQTTLTLTQNTPAYQLNVPLRLRTRSGETQPRLQLSQERQTFSVSSAEPPIGITLDPQFRVFRRLAPGEAPPILRSVMLADNVSMPDLAQDELIRTRSRLLARQLLENPPREWRPENVEDQGPMLIIGRHEDVDRWLAARSLPTRPAEVAANRGTAQVWTLQEKSGSVIAVISATDAAALDALQRPLPHYGQQSFLVFEGGRVVSQGTWPARPQQINFARTDQAEAP